MCSEVSVLSLLLGVEGVGGWGLGREGDTNCSYKDRGFLQGPIHLLSRKPTVVVEEEASVPCLEDFKASDRFSFPSVFPCPSLNSLRFLQRICPLHHQQLYYSRLTVPLSSFLLLDHSGFPWWGANFHLTNCISSFFFFFLLLLFTHAWFPRPCWVEREGGRERNSITST